MVEILIDKLAQLGISIGLHEHGQIRVNTGKEKMPPDLLAAIKDQKEEIIIYLKSNQQEGRYNKIPNVPESENYPLSSTQRRLWILSQFEQSNIAYNMPRVQEFDMFIDAGCLNKAFMTLIERHEILRTVFRQDANGEIRQFILEPAKTGFCISSYDLREEKEQEETLNAILRSESLKPFDISEGPLLRACLCRKADEKWVLIFVMHHIISDAWSMNVLISELFLFYNGHVNGVPDQLPPLRIQYKDFSAWQMEQLNDASADSHKTYWLKQFEGDVPVSEFPGDRLRPSVKTYNGATVYGHISKDLSECLNELCREQGCTLFMGLMAAVNILLYRYTGHEDIVIGSPIAGREHADLENQIGFYVNTLALRTRFKGSDSFTGVLTKSRETALDAFAHQIYPFDELVDALKLRRDASRNPLFEIQIVLQNAEATENKVKKEEAKPGNAGYNRDENRGLVFDMVFNFTQKPDGINISLAYNRDIYDGETAEQLVRHLQQLLSSAAGCPYCPVRELDLLNDEERAQLLLTFNDTGVVFQGAKTLVELFTAQAVKSPDNVAVVYEGSEFTYREICEKAGKLANYLKTACALKKGEPVGVILERSDNMITAMLGVMMAGGVYVPIDPGYPADRKTFIINDAGLQVLITQSDYIFNLEFQGLHIIAVDIQLEEVDLPVTYSGDKVNPSDLAYIIYTSGSTGTPKGVMIEHRSVINTINSQQVIFGISENDRGLQFSSASFDASVWEIFLILSVGATLYIIDEKSKKDVLLLEKYITENRIDIATIPPAYLKMLRVEKMASLKQLITAGESAIAEKAHAFAEYGTYYNAYGPTESSICATVFRYSKENHTGLSNIPVGVPICNTQIYITDEAGNLLPLGAVGEISIGGAGIARGYWNAPALTAEKFLDNPFRKGERIYKTGDLGRWLRNGNIEFAGRRDDQVKVFGNRIELGEIERTLMAHDGVDMAVVLAMTGADGDKELVAFIKPVKQLNVSDLRLYLGKTLPGYMIPHHFTEVETFPLNTSGKVDRKKLQQTQGIELGVLTEYVAAGTETEKQLVEIWEDILCKEKVGIKDDFFELGGSSLKAMKIIKQVIDKLGVSLTIKTIFDGKTIENIAGHIHSQVTAPASTSGSFVCREPAMVSEASFNQLIYFAKWNSKGDFPIVSTYEYEDIDVELLRQALSLLVARHEMLRTVFITSDGKVMQKVLSMEEIDIKIPPVVAVASAVEVSIDREKEYSRKFDLSAFPLFRIKIYRLPSGSCKVLVTKHHSITDGYSEGVLKRELDYLYVSVVQNSNAELPHLPYQYRDFSRWQRQFVNSETGHAHRNYWLNKLEGFSPSVKMGSIAREVLPGSPKVSIVAGSITGQLHQAVDEFARSRHLTRTALLMGTLALTVSQLSAQEDITLFTAVSGRDSQYYGNLDVSGLVGFFPNLLLVRHCISRQKTAAEYLHDIQDDFMNDLAHDAYPFEKLVQELPGEAGENLLDNTVFFNYHNYSHNLGIEIESFPDVEEEKQMGDFPLQFAMVLSITEYKNCLNIQFMFNSNLFDPADRMRVKDLFYNTLGNLIGNPGIVIDEIYKCKSQ